MQLKNILTLISLASAAPLLQIRQEGVDTVTSWEVQTVTQYTTIWVAPGSVPTTISPAGALPTSSSSTTPAATATPPAAPPAVAPIQPKPLTAIQQIPTQQAPPVIQPTTTSIPPPVQASPAPETVAAPSAAAGKSAFKVSTLVGAQAPNGPCTPDQPCSGDITHYNPSQGVGSCGPKDWATGAIWTDNDIVVAVSHTIMGTRSNGGTPDSVNDLCKRSVHIKGQAGGQDVVAKVVDKCAGCSMDYALDLSPAVWAKVAPNGDGRVHDVEWYWV